MTTYSNRDDLITEGLNQYTIIGDFLLSDFEPARRLLDAQSMVLNGKYRDPIVEVLTEWSEHAAGLVALSSSPCSIILAAEVSKAVRKPMLMVEPRRRFPVPDQIEEFALKGPGVASGATVNLVIDVCVTGRSALSACRTLREYGLTPAVLAILDRERGATEELSKARISFRRMRAESELWATERSESYAPLASEQIRAQSAKLQQVYPMRLKSHSQEPVVE